jgi:hypothetical protein
MNKQVISARIALKISAETGPQTCKPAADRARKFYFVSTSAVTVILRFVATPCAL